MKIVAGLGSIDDFLPYVKAGADELFFGYVPFEYMEQFGRRKALNRREVIYYNVQIGSESEIMILNHMQDNVSDVGLVVALNALCFDERQEKYIQKYIDECKNHGLHKFIVSDEKLIRTLGEIKDIEIHISGEFGIMNSLRIKNVYNANVKRIIFPRQTSLEDMEAVICNTKDLNLSYEAFALNEKCQFTGAYCNSLHCDELCHMCKVPYRLSNTSGDYEDCSAEYENILGETGCGICSIDRLRRIGVTHLKVVSRGNGTDETVRDIEGLKKALDIQSKSSDEKSYIDNVKRELFPNGCSKNCYFKLWE